MVGWGSLAGLAGSNGPVFKNQRMAKVAPAMTSSRSRAIVQPQIFIRRRFFRSRSSHVSLANQSKFVFESVVDRGTYVCLSGGRLDEAVDVDCESETVAFSSSRCTAIENRFQNAGSRTPAMTIFCRKRASAGDCQWNSGRSAGVFTEKGWSVLMFVDVDYCYSGLGKEITSGRS